jgi:hypothetical protein
LVLTHNDPKAMSRHDAGSFATQSSQFYVGFYALDVVQRSSSKFATQLYSEKLIAFSRHF